MRIARVFFNVSMAYGFPGLSSVLKDAGVKVAELGDEALTVFVNKKHTRFKALFGQSYLIYHNNGGRPFPLEAIQNFPLFFDGKKIDIPAAVKKSVLEKLAKS